MFAWMHDFYTDANSCYNWIYLFKNFAVINPKSHNIYYHHKLMRSTKSQKIGKSIYARIAILAMVARTAITTVHEKL